MTELYRQFSSNKEKAKQRKSFKATEGANPYFNSMASNNKNLTLTFTSPQKNSDGKSSHRSRTDLKKHAKNIKKNIQNIISGKNQFMIRLLKYAARKLEFYNEDILSKSMKWIEKEITNFLPNKSEEETCQINDFFNFRDGNRYTCNHYS